MRTILGTGAALSALLIAGAALAQTPEDYPPNARPGHCYQHVMRPAVTETYQEKEIVSPEHVATRIIPAVYGEVDKQVVVREGHIDHIQVPATYRTVTESEVVRPEITRTEVIPAEYETVTERIMVQDAHSEWRRGVPGPVSDPDMPRGRPYGDILCLIRIPAEYRIETRRILRSPERVVHITDPALYRPVTRQVVDQPAHEITREVPPILSTVREKVVVRPERTETYTVPAVYRIVTRTRVIAPEHLEWREFTCRNVRHLEHPRDMGADGERGALAPIVVPGAPAAHVLAQNSIGEHGVTPDGSIARLQSALAQRGYYSGPIDGLFTIPTGDALTRFQKDKDLPLGGFNFPTAQALNLQ